MMQKFLKGAGSYHTILAAALTLANLCLYGYGRTVNDDFSEYALPALFKLHPENFIHDPVFSYITDRHFVFTWFLRGAFSVPGTEIILFIFFLLAKFLMYLGLVKLASLVLDKKVLAYVCPVFLLPIAEFNLQFGWMGVSATYLLPRSIAWALWLMGFYFLLKNKKIAAAGLFALSSLMHAHFMLLTLPVFALALGLDRVHGKKMGRTEFESLGVLLVGLLPNIIHAPGAAAPLFHETALTREIFLRGFPQFHYNPAFILARHGASFLMLCLPLLYVQRLKIAREQMRLWLGAVGLIIFGTLACLAITWSHPGLAIAVWYGGFTSFVSLTGLIFFMRLSTLAWTKWAPWRKCATIAGIYLVALWPTILAVAIFLYLTISGAIKFFSREKKMAPVMELAILILLLSYAMSSYSKLYVITGLRWPDMAIYQGLYNFAKNETPQDAMFLLPPYGFDEFRSLAWRGAVVTAKTHLYGSYLPIWKARMLDVTQSEALPQPSEYDTRYFSLGPAQVMELAEKYQATYFVTATEQAQKFLSYAGFQLVYQDQSLSLFAITVIAPSGLE